jgi:uncharacterized protein YrrD
VDDPGAPLSYVALAEGTPVFSSDGHEIGVVQEVLADTASNIFDGIVVDTRSGPGGLRFVDAPEVGEIYERAVMLTLDAASCEVLPTPSANPAVMEVRPGDVPPRGVSAGLRRMWDRLSGRG